MPGTRTTVVLGAGGRQLWCLTLHSCGGLMTGRGSGLGHRPSIPRTIINQACAHPLGVCSLLGKRGGLSLFPASHCALSCWSGVVGHVGHRAELMAAQAPFLSVDSHWLFVRLPSLRAALPSPGSCPPQRPGHHFLPRAVSSHRPLSLAHSSPLPLALFRAGPLLSLDARWRWRWGEQHRTDRPDSPPL